MLSYRIKLAIVAQAKNLLSNLRHPKDMRLNRRPLILQPHHATTVQDSAHMYYNAHADRYLQRIQSRMLGERLIKLINRFRYIGN